ncbi:hypothetical protein L6R53_24525 [Myxococcota bacterium]|nr:hypothetical protein [Myxococcota bacterium]
MILAPLLLLTLAARAEDGVHAPPPDAPPEQLDPAALPEGWTLVAPPAEGPLAIPGPGTPPPPPPPTSPPPGWREVAPPAGVASAVPPARPVDQRDFAVGGTIGGGATVAVDGLLRLSPTLIADLGVGPQLDVRTGMPGTTRVLLGLSWQPGQRTARHGAVLRGGLGYRDLEDGPRELAVLGGYAWRLVPHGAATSWELETGPALFVRGLADPGPDWTGLAWYGRAGIHFWLR